MNPDVLSAPLRLLRACVHALVGVLLVVAAGRGLAEGGSASVGIAAAALLFAAVYAVGPALRPVRQASTGAVIWLGALTASWLLLLALTPDGVWLAFPLFLLELHLLPTRWGVPAVVGTTIAAVVGFAAHRGATPAVVVGPVLGAAVSVATVLGYQALYRESEQRRRLIEQLTATRAELAAAEHAAGVIAERERLAREIHDTLAQGLTSIQLLLRAAGRALPADPDTAASHVEQARQAAQQNLVEARRFVRGLAPAALDGASLQAALQRLCRTTTEQSGIRAHLDVDGDPIALPTAHEVALLRIAQSGLSNVVRHSGATCVKLTLSYLTSHVTLDIVDDGVGFDPQSVGSQARGDGGFGLTAMDARARELGGTLGVESAPGRGTALTVSFPYDAIEEEPRPT